jgi:hypothetical protein
MARPDNDNTGIRKLSLAGSKSYTVSIPIEIIRQLKWQKGQTLVVRRIAKNVVISQKDIS